MSANASMPQKQKHAFLIMAHHKPELLQLILNALDNPYVTFIIHIDRKFKEKFSLKTKYSKIIFTKRMRINWGGYSQIKGTLLLLQSALNTGENYSYLHFITGATYPIKPINEILNYFDNDTSKEYIGFDNERDFDFRIKYYYPFSELGKPNSRLDLKKISVRNKIVALQKKLKVNRLKNKRIEIKKGTSYFSITPDFARYLLSKKKQIKKLFNHTVCADEVFVQTMIWNSTFKENIYDDKDEYNGSKVISCWPKAVGEYRENLSFIEKDFDILEKTSAFFGCKFESEESLKLINKINKELLKLN